MQQRTVAAALRCVPSQVLVHAHSTPPRHLPYNKCLLRPAQLRMPVDVENRTLRFDDLSLSRLESVLFDSITNQSVELPQVGSFFILMTAWAGRADEPCLPSGKS